MELTKEQIQFIEDYLKEQKVKFWDVRIELIDHIASKLEENPEIKLTRTFLIREFGTSITLDKLVHEKQKAIDKKYRNLFFKEAFNFFKSSKKVLVLILFLLVYFLAFQYFLHSAFKVIAIVVFGTPVFLYVFAGFKNHFFKEKSIYLEAAFIYIIIFSLIFQYFLQIINPKGIFDTANFANNIILLIAPPLNAFFSYCGFVVYRKAYKKHSKTYKQLKSI